jgi:hypothetical protein
VLRRGRGALEHHAAELAEHEHLEELRAPLAEVDGLRVRSCRRRVWSPASSRGRQGSRRRHRRVEARGAPGARAPLAPASHEARWQ